LHLAAAQDQTSSGGYSAASSIGRSFVIVVQVNVEVYVEVV
jgi:hypothetical protein